MIQKHPYIAATLVATLLAIVVWLCVPKEYTAITKVSDEYKEMDLAIGLTDMQAHIRNLQNKVNKGFNDMNTYRQLLKTEDFARQIARKQVAGKNMTYGTYLGEQDTIKAVLDCINYSYSERHETLTITFTDRDPLVAAQMLDSVTVLLQQTVTEARRKKAQVAMDNARNDMKNAEAAYHTAQQRYAAFTDSNWDVNSSVAQQRGESLQKDIQLAYKHYEDATNEYVREEALMQRSYLSFAVVKANTAPLTCNNYFIGYLLSFLVIALLLTHGIRLYQRKKASGAQTTQWGNVFSPWAITILIWAFVLGLYYLLDTELYPIQKQFYVCFALWFPIFCLCSLATYYILPETKELGPITGGINFNKSLYYFFFVISLIITPLYVYRIIQIVTMFGSDDLMNNVRTLALYGEGQGILNYSAVINQSLFVVALWAHPKIPTWQVVLLGLACLMNGLAIMEKGTLFFVFVCLIFVLYEKRVIRLRSIAVSAAVVLVLFYIFNLGRAGEDSDYQKEETLFDFFTLYALSPPVAFSQLLPEVIPQFGTNTFESVYLFLERFGMDVVVKDKLQEFVWVPIPTNVYTVFQPFYMDFGYRGVAFFAMIYGCACGWMYRLYRNGNSFGCCLFTYFVDVLILQFYQENVFFSLVAVLQFTFFIAIFTQQKIKLTL